MTTEWQLSNPRVERHLERTFSQRSIDFSAPGFCDSESFLRVEAADPRFLEKYAQYVEARHYEASYLSEALRKIDIVASAVCDSVERDGRPGACVHASGMVARMLDRLGLWNYLAKTTLSISFGETGPDPVYFWVLDEGEFIASHAMVVAPPYGVIDVTVKQQPYTLDRRSLLPRMIRAARFELSKWAVDDLANPAVRLAARSAGFRTFRDYLKARYPYMLDVMKALPARIVNDGDITLKYVLVAIGGFTEQLEDLAGYEPCGRTALEIFEKDVVPRLESTQR